MSDTLLEYKCPHCGGGLTFDIGTQQMKCPYCESLIDVASLKEREDAAAAKDAEKDAKKPGGAGEVWSEEEREGFVTYSCRSCGASIVAEETAGVTACPYCDSPVVMIGQFSGGLRPDIIIPFKLDRDAARQAFKKHLCHKALLPKAFKREHHIDEIKGLYVPFWLFSGETGGVVQYEATKVRTWSDRKYNYTETSFYDVYREGSIAFDDIPADGSEKMPDDLMESIEPYDLGAAVPFQSAYMSGYAADRYDVDEAASVPRAEARMRQSAADAFASTVTGFSSVRAIGSDLHTQNTLTRYAMLPVWLLNTTWKGRRYTFAMNGQTGRFAGDLPVSKGAYAGILLSTMLLITALAELVAWLLGV